MGFFKFKSLKFKNFKLKSLVYITFFLFLLGIVWHFFRSYKKEGFASGTVKWFNESKGFGFITPEEGGPELFVHVTSLEGNTIRENDAVTFDIATGLKGPTAINVQGGSAPLGGLSLAPAKPAPALVKPAPAPAKPAPAPAKPAPAPAPAKPAPKKK
jgi:CspA family cold shock protein